VEETIQLQAYDIIGDVHGCADKLEGLLGKLGFEERAGAYRHPERQAIFVGDLIDRGPQQVETLNLVHSMVEAGSAQIVMGNHEFNAISYATKNLEVPDDFLRPHNAKNNRQHQAFLEQVPNPHRWIEWFKTMPLYLDLGGLRVVHACWNAGAMSVVGAWVTHGAPMRTEFLVLANQRGSDEYKAIEILLKGPELSLVEKDQCGFMDKDGNIRSDARIRWLAWLLSTEMRRRSSMATTGARGRLNRVGTGRQTLPVSISAPSRVDQWWPTDGKGRRRSHVRSS
jgi:hypothetical protein